MGGKTSAGDLVTFSVSSQFSLLLLHTKGLGSIPGSAKSCVWPAHVERRTQHLRHLRITAMRLGEGVCLSGSLDPNWGHQGSNVCSESKANST